jgi:hypothetical protein
MFGDIHAEMIGALGEGLKGIVPVDNITVGKPQKDTVPSVSAEIIEYYFEEQGIGQSTGVKMERHSDTFPTDGKQKDFPLSQPAVKLPIVVESPKGKVLNEVEDYSLNYETSTVSFRNPVDNPKHEIIITYTIKRGVAEVRILAFNLTYTLTVTDKTVEGRDRVALEVMKTLFRKRADLLKKGIREITLIGGYATEDTLPKDRYATTIEYQIEATTEIEMAVPPMERIEIGKKE